MSVCLSVCLSVRVSSPKLHDGFTRRFNPLKGEAQTALFNPYRTNVENRVSS